jgi:hypothetical protein
MYQSFIFVVYKLSSVRKLCLYYNHNKQLLTILQCRKDENMLNRGENAIKHTKSDVLFQTCKHTT